MSLSAIPLATAIALIRVVWVTAIAPVYVVEAGEGVLPSTV
jgi:hypothetical protein